MIWYILIGLAVLLFGVIIGIWVLSTAAYETFVRPFEKFLKKDDEPK